MIILILILKLVIGSIKDLEFTDMRSVLLFNMLNVRNNTMITQFLATILADMVNLLSPFLGFGNIRRFGRKYKYYLVAAQTPKQPILT